MNSHAYFTPFDRPGQGARLLDVSGFQD